MISRRQIIESQQAMGAESELDFGENGDGRQEAVLSRQANEVQRQWGQSRVKADTGEMLRAFGGAGGASSTRETPKLTARQEAAKVGREEAAEEELDLGGSNEDDEQELAGQDYRHFDPYSVYGEEDEEEDVWYSEERLFEDHLQEIIDKWMAIDDEIWAKIICMERNRRVAKAYARKHSLTVNGSEDEYLDGTSLGLNSFENPDRDAKTRHIKQHIGHGLRIKITSSGDIVVRRLSKSGVFVHQVSSLAGLNLAHASSQDIYGALEGPGGADNNLYGAAASVAPHSSSSSFSAVLCGGAPGQPRWPRRSRRWDEAASHASSSSSSGVAAAAAAATSTTQTGAAKRQLSSQQLQTQALDYNQTAKVFDMSQFKWLLEEEARKPRPNRRLLQQQCISVISFVLDDQKLLNLPAWIMVINIVAIDLLRSELGLLELQEPELLGPAPASPLSLDEPADEEEEEEEAEPELFSPRRRNRLAASKKAFADAAASGAYNTSSQQAGQRPRPAAGNQPQQHQQASSSGFNSNCSSQNNSSAASSSSNSIEQPPKPSPQQEEGPKLQQRNPLAADHEKPADETRGRRPPRLPLRAKPALQQQQQPPPPPPGKANLILVAPTGLSPPLPKRKGPPLVAPATRDQFLTIKLIDENGQCSLIKAAGGRQQHPLPAGIPAHAQLAPPATQRHILNYLRAAAAATASGSGEARPPRRPLPLAPDESLYYCGLRARVPAHRQQQQRAPARPLQLPLPPPRHPVSTSAINAILRDFKRASQQHHHYQNPHFRHQFSLTNLSAASGGQQRRSEQTYGSSQYLQQAQKAVEQSLARQPAGKASGLIRFFSRSANKRQEKEIMFLSADNLTRQPAASGRILGILPRSQKAPKIKPGRS